jgi:hypothetical protein
MAVLESRPNLGRSVLGTTLKWGVIGGVILLTLATLWIHEAYVFRPADPQWTHLAPFKWLLLPHVAGGATALLLSPLQFSATLRRRAPAAHRWLGRIYATAVIVSASLSLWIVFGFEAPSNWAVMGAMGGLWLFATIFAWLAAANRDFFQHQLWMGRSVGLSLTFVATRFVPDVLLRRHDYEEITALYWTFIVLALVVPDLVMNPHVLGFRRRRAAVKTPRPGSSPSGT